MRRIHQCLNRTTSALCQQTLLLEALQEKVNQYIPQHLHAHCQVGQFTKGQLFLTIRNPIFATELRYLLPQLRDYLRSEGRLYQLVSIKLNIEPALFSYIDSAQNNTYKKLSADSQQRIIAAAKNCKYEPLKDVLMSIAKREI